MAEYDEKNKEDFDNNTDKIWAALDAIRQDKKLKATKSQVIALTGLHRNTLDPKGARSWVGLELSVIKNLRLEESIRDKITQKQQEDNLQELLDQSKLEILNWFAKYSESERELEKIRIRLKRDNDSLEWYKAELEKERKIKRSLEERLDLLENIINDKAADKNNNEA